MGPITSPPLPAPAPGFVVGHVTAIGDSVLIDAEYNLAADVPGVVVDAAVSRQWSDGEAIARGLLARHQLGSVVVIELGTNGPITAEDFDSMMSILHGASRVVFVTTHDNEPWQDQVNAVLAWGVATHRSTALADWATLARQFPGWFYADGVHLPLGGSGAQAMAALIADQL